MDLRIRNAIEGDIPSIIQLRQEYDEVIADRRPDLYKLADNYTEEEVRGFLGAHHSEVIVAESTNNVIAGYAIVDEEKVNEHKIYRERKVLFIRDFCVREEIRGAGVGQSLMEFIIELGKERQANAIEIDVLADNERAEAFLESNGMSTKSIRYEMEID
ncbi:GNAT family N-acetyltransferase [Paenibacillus sp. 453mf]|uniref:GNAT family N-acetyltransferase n=1 Tax=Paenibacillus sp. 453mf TaxID=1761874 RepID=UPI0008E29864|nr:GNAT family N-acetyltransferase [Paenibacillus sp. 453mf]SFS54290.1 Ribosomal protein S18 acetylase RimI [Paenibacillus sp. 453mf]